MRRLAAALWALGLACADATETNPSLDGGPTADAGTAVDSGPGPAVVYYRDIKPILETHCTGCHSPGGIGPIDLTVPAVAVAARTLVKEQVESGLMPPWHASADCRPYLDERRLTAAEIQALGEWSDLGGPLGDERDAAAPIPPPPPAIRIDKRLPTSEMYGAAAGDDYRCFVLEWDEVAPKFVTGFNLLPSNQAIVHHANIYVAEPNGVAAYRTKDEAAPGPGYPCFGGAFEPGSALLGAWAPGSNGIEYPAGTGVQIDPGSVIVMEMHFYVGDPNNNQDQSTLALELADTVERRALVAPFWNFQEWSQGRNMPIPADQADVMHSITFDPNGFVPLIAPWLTNRAIRIYGAGLHMHYLGTRGTVAIRRPNADECLLEIPRWDFNWQYGYLFTEPTDFLIGEDRLYLECHWDNTAANQPIIDGARRPVRDVNWGGRSTDEMCIGYVYVTER